LFIKRL